jgi:hypothetical protein
MVAGSHPGDYLIDNRCQATVAIGASCLVGVRFDPQRPGGRRASLMLLTNAATAPAAVSLSGTGGTVELLTCKRMTRQGRTLQTCHARLVAGTLSFLTSVAAVDATISRRGTVYGTGLSLATADASVELALNEARPLRRGQYTLTLHSQQRHHTITRRIPITIE